MKKDYGMSTTINNLLFKLFFMCIIFYHKISKKPLDDDDDVIDKISDTDDHFK